MQVSLRPAKCGDTEFMWRVQHETLGEIITAEFGTNEGEQRAFFDEHLVIDAHQIVTCSGTDCGFLFYERRCDHFYLGNLAIIPEFQGRGIGTSIVTDIFDQANAERIPVRLQVLKGNRAIEFWRHHGFLVDHVSEHHHQMIRLKHGS